MIGRDNAVGLNGKNKIDIVIEVLRICNCALWTREGWSYDWGKIRRLGRRGRFRRSKGGGVWSRKGYRRKEDWELQKRDMGIGGDEVAAGE